MNKLVLRGAFLAAALALSSCEEESAIDVAAKNLNVATTNSILFTGNGMYGRVGQQFSNASSWAQIPVPNYTMTIDYANQASHVQMTRAEPSDADKLPNTAFRKEYFNMLGATGEEFVAGDKAWNASPTNPMQPAMATVEERQAAITATPVGFVKFAQENKAPVRKTRRGADTTFTVGKHKYYGRFNAANDLELVQEWIDNPVLGDMLIQTQYSDYKNFGGVHFPSKITRIVGEHPALRLTVTGVKANVPANITVPDEVKNYQEPPIVVAEELLAPGVWHLRGGSHHSLLIEQADHLIVVEAPQTEARSMAVIAKAKELAPNKPIKFIVNTHTHFDHSGGLRTYVAEGATVVTHAVNEEYYKKAWANPRTINPDAMAQKKAAATFQPVADKYTLSDGKRSVDLYAMKGLNHTDAMLMVYLPTEKVIAVADVYAPAPADAAPPEAPIPGAVALIENMERVGATEVTKVAGLHGTRVGTVEDLLIDAGRMQPKGAKAKAKPKAK